MKSGLGLYWTYKKSSFCLSSVYWTIWYKHWLRGICTNFQNWFRQILLLFFLFKIIFYDLHKHFYYQDDPAGKKNSAKFAQVWNEFIISMRMEDLVSNRLKLPPPLCMHHLIYDFICTYDKMYWVFFLYMYQSIYLSIYPSLWFFREKDLLLVPYSSTSIVSVVQWPPFLLASKVGNLKFLLFI